MGTTEKIAKFVQELRFEQIPARGVEQTKVSMLDTIGTALLGSRGQSGEILTRYITQMGGNPHATVIGRGMKTSLELAALANGTFAHADDFDDIGSFGHAGAFLTAPLLALGEWLHLPGRKLIEAYAVGFDLGTRLRASIGDLVTAGFHTSCLLGTISTAAESAKLLGLDIARTRGALGIAASLASGIMQNFGTHTKPFHAGHASRNGVLAALLAKEGLTSSLEALEGARGFYYVYGQEQAMISRLTDHLGKILAVAEEGVGVKPWPCCGGNHEALTAMLRLIETHQIKPQDVESVEVATSWRTPGPCVCVETQAPFEGKFNINYNMASALIDRKVDLETYTEEKYRRPDVQALMSRVIYIQHPDRRNKPQSLQSESRFAVVTVRMKDGRVLSEYQGAEERRKLTGQEVLDKYRKNAGMGGLSAGQINRSIDLLEKLETLPDITPVMDAVSGRV